MKGKKKSFGLSKTFGMDMHLLQIAVIGCLTSVLVVLTSAEGDIPPLPIFPDVFETEVQGINKGWLTEFDAQIHYDRKNNRVAMVFTQDGESTRSIYNFDDKQLLSIQGGECSVSDISEQPEEIFFLFDLDEKNNTKLAKAEKLFHFTNSNYHRKEFCVLPSDVYEATIDLPLYERKKCNVSHYFSTQEEELPDCEGHTCKPTIMAITLNCPKTDEQDELDQVFNFYRFRSGIENEDVFRIPTGIFCNTTDLEGFPRLPEYYSFSYRTLEDQEGGRGSAGVYSMHKRIWYDSKLSLVRIDEFDASGLLETSRILDSYGGMGYTSVASVQRCIAGPITDAISYGQMTSLPEILFKKAPMLNDAVYVGTRSVNGLTYYVWSLSFVNEETDAVIVQEFYFAKILLNDEVYSKMELSHINIYVSERNDDTFIMERSVVSYISVSNFRTKPKEWEAFDISSCFSHTQKKGFKLKVEGPAIIKGSYMYEDLLERLYIKLISITKVSLIRINQLKGTFDSVYITEFNGWILEKPQSLNKSKNLEPDMQTAYNLIKDAASAGKLSLKIKNLDKDIEYVVTAMEEIEHPNTTTDGPTKDITDGPTRGTTDRPTRDITDGPTRDSTVGPTESITGAPAENKSKGCYSGGSLAATGLTLFALGIFLGTVGYYVFLKKRKPRSNEKIQLSAIAEETY